MLLICMHYRFTLTLVSGLTTNTHSGMNYVSWGRFSPLQSNNFAINCLNMPSSYCAIFIHTPQHDDYSVAYILRCIFVVWTSIIKVYLFHLILSALLFALSFRHTLLNTAHHITNKFVFRSFIISNKKIKNIGQF